MITLIPNAGLCNRMRAIDSALALCQLHPHKLKIYWERNTGLNCRFDELFQPLPSDMVTIKEVSRKPYRFYNPDDVNRPFVRNVLRGYQRFCFSKTLYINDIKEMVRKGYNFYKLSREPSLLIESSSRFIFPEQQPWYCYFRPLPNIQAEINQVSEQFSSDTIGVHIRRADHQKAIENSPITLFIQEMQRQIDANTSANFFVASDDKETKLHLQKQFGDRIMLYTLRGSERGNAAGMAKALVDLYALSRTKKVLASYGSSFSHTACHISGIEEVIIKGSSKLDH